MTPILVPDQAPSCAASDTDVLPRCWCASRRFRQTALSDPTYMRLYDPWRERDFQVTYTPFDSDQRTDRFFEGSCGGCPLGAYHVEFGDEVRKHWQCHLAALKWRRTLQPKFRHYVFETFPGDPALVKLVRRFMDDVFDWRRRKRALLLVGPPSTGKTGLAVAAMSYLVFLMADLEDRWDYLPEFVAMPDIVGRLWALIKGASGTEADVFSPIRKAPAAILDEIGGERVSDVMERRLLHGLFDPFTVKRTPLIMTTNYSLDQLESRIGTPIAERIIEDAEIVDMTGQVNLRLLRARLDAERRMRH